MTERARVGIGAPDHGPHLPDPFTSKRIPDPKVGSMPTPTRPFVLMEIPPAADGGPPAMPASSLMVEPSNLRSALPFPPLIVIPVSALGVPNAMNPPPLPPGLRSVAPFTSNRYPGNGLFVPMATLPVLK